MGIYCRFNYLSLDFLLVLCWEVFRKNKGGIASSRPSVTRRNHVPPHYNIAKHPNGFLWHTWASKMILILLFWLASITKTLAAQDPGHFINPPIAEGPEDYHNNLVWTVGETQKIQWTTIYPSFTIALWQQDLGGGGGREGPTIFGKEHCFRLLLQMKLIAGQQSLHQTTYCQSLTLVGM